MILGSNRWSNISSFKDLTPIVNDNNIIYNFHFFNPLTFTHQFAPWVDNPECRIEREYPGTYLPKTEPFGRITINDYGTWNRDRLKNELNPIFEWREKYNRPILCNQFGVMPKAPRASQLNYLKDLISIFEEEGINWTFWNYKNLDFGLISDGEILLEDLPQFQNPYKRDNKLAKILSDSI